MAQIKFGGHELLRAVARFEDGVLDEVKRIVYETARVIQSNAKALAPVDLGNLRDSIEVTILNGGYVAKVTVGANYAVWVEYGTGIYSTQGNGRLTPWTYYSAKLGRYVTTKGNHAQPFWEPAVEAGKRYFEQQMRQFN